jgi:hypothetical protein
MRCNQCVRIFNGRRQAVVREANGLGILVMIRGLVKRKVSTADFIHSWREDMNRALVLSATSTHQSMQLLVGHVCDTQ